MSVLTPMSQERSYCNGCHATDLLYTHLTKKEKAMGKKGISHRKFSIEFKLSVLSDYFQSNQS
ncbi:MAG: hypothetical protein MSK40_00985, partial [Parabacteroides sp.]|nr:hypothetical protein [Parabacteroides sp.]